MKWKLSWLANKSQKPGSVVMVETNEGLAVLYGVLLPNTKPTVIAETFIKSTLPNEQIKALRDFVEQQALTNVSCTYFLQARDYSLNLIESPSVSEEEIPMALRWVLKDTLSFPLEEAVIDSFEVPFVRARDNIKMRYAVVTQRAVVEKIESLVEATGLNLASINIPELALNNLLSLDGSTIKSGAIAFLSKDKQSKLILCRDSNICLARSIELDLSNLGKTPEQDAKTLESLSVEFQRSFDYMNSLFRQSIQNLIVMMPTVVDRGIVGASLKTNLGAEIMDFDFSDKMQFQNNFPQTEAYLYTVAVGGLLMDKEKTA